MNDARIVAELARGSRAAMGELVAAVEKPLLAFIERYVGEVHTAEDLFQETFVKVIHSIGSFTPRAKLTTWVFAIARNLCIDHLRARKRRREVAEEGAAVVPFPGPGADPARDAGREEDRRRLNEAVQRLAPPKREALVLRFFAGRSYEEIGEIVRAPVGTVKFRVHEAVRELAATLGRAAGKESGDDVSGSA